MIKTIAFLNNVAISLNKFYCIGLTMKLYCKILSAICCNVLPNLWKYNEEIECNTLCKQCKMYLRQQLVHTYNEIVSVIIDGCIQIILPLFQP